MQVLDDGSEHQHRYSLTTDLSIVGEVRAMCCSEVCQLSKEELINQYSLTDLSIVGKVRAVCVWGEVASQFNDCD